MLKFLKDLVFPPVCVICGADDVHLCLKCQAAVHKNIRFTKFEGQELDGLISCCAYNDNSIIAKVIHCFKYEFICELSEILGMTMFEAIKQSSLQDFVLCPVPLHKKREKWRGFNQSKILTNEIGLLGGFETCEFLRRTKYKQPQMELGQEERVRNVRNSFVIMDGVTIDKSRPVVLVDDVFTTGATMRECAKALKEVGFRLVYGLVIAQTV